MSQSRKFIKSLCYVIGVIAIIVSLADSDLETSKRIWGVIFGIVLCASVKWTKVRWLVLCSFSVLLLISTLLSVIAGNQEITPAWIIVVVLCAAGACFGWVKADVQLTESVSLLPRIRKWCTDLWEKLQPKLAGYSEQDRVPDDKLRGINTVSELKEFYSKHSFVDEIHTKVVGVTYNNEDGSSRQMILSRCQEGDPVFLKPFKWQGDPAYAVVSEHGQIGCLSAELAARIETDYGGDLTAQTTITEITGGYDGLNYGCNIQIRLFEDQCEEYSLQEDQGDGTFHTTAIPSDGESGHFPVRISKGNIAKLSDEEMHIFLLHYYKAEEIRTKVKGVTFRNDDGTNRQSILMHCHAGDQLRFKFYEYKGSPAYAVYCDWGEIGNLSEELAKEIAARAKPCILLGEILNVSGGYHGEYFGCNICVNVYEKY